MRPRLFDAPALSVRERATLLAAAVFAGPGAPRLLARLGRRGEELSRALAAAPGDARALALELRRLVDRRFEGLERVHPSWFTAAVAGESGAVRAAALSLFPVAAGPRPARPPSPGAAAVLRAALSGGLAEMPPAAAGRAGEARLSRLDELPGAALSALVAALGEEALGRALVGVGEEAARRLAQRLERRRGEELLRGFFAGPSPAALSLLRRALARLNLSLAVGSGSP